MKLIIRYCLQWGNFTTQAINIDEDADVSALQAKIKEKFDVVESQQVLKFKKDGATIKLVQGFPLTHYGVKEKSIVFLEKAEAQVDDEEIKQDNYVNKGGYFAKLGIMGKIDEDEEDEGTANIKDKINSWSYSGSMSAGSDGLIEAQVSSDEEGSEATKDSSAKGALYARLRNQSKNLLKEVKDSNIDKVKEIFNSFEGEKKEQQIRKVIDQLLAETGWNLMHWACYGGHTQIVKLFLDYDSNLNIETNDGWTSLQLAAFKNHIEVAKVLLAKKIVDINQITSKGTALHIAAKNARPEMVTLLLENKADPGLRDEQNALPLDVASNDKIIELIQTAVKKQTEDKFKPPKPPIVKGFMYKRGTYFGKMNQRFMVLNPDEGTLIRYKYKEDYPNKPKEIIPLKSIEGARRMKAGPLYDKTFYYVQVLYQKRYIYACHNEETANQWVKYIIQGVVYANYVEGKLQKEKNKKGAKESQKEAINYFEDPSEEVVIDDPVPASKLGSKNGSKEDPKLKDGQVNFNSFEVVSILGSGAFGRVFKVVRKGSDKVYAMKALKKHNLIVKNQLRYAVTEANVLKMSSHPFVLQLHYAFQTPQHLYLVLDLCPGGDLSLHLANKGVFTEEEVKFYIAELILAIEHIHSLDVIYRDLKPENILLDEEGHIKLADFGLAKENIGKDDVARSFCGSPAYLSPEMVKRRGVGKSADLYGIGTVMFELLTGEAPYYNDEIPKLYQNIARAKLDIPNNLSMEARDLITRLLDRDPEQRLGARDRNELRNHPFFAGIDWEKLERKELMPPKLDALADDDIEMPLSSKIKDSDYNEKNKKINRVKNYTFVRDKPEIDLEQE